MSKRYTDQERDNALAELVVLGNSEIVAQRTGIPAQTLRDWRHRHAERFYELSKLHEKASEASLAAKMREIAHKSIDAASDAVDQVSTLQNAGHIKEASLAASTAHKLMYPVGIPVDKLMQLEGRPTVVIQHTDTKALLAKYGGYIEGEAEELPPTPELPAA